MKKILILSLFLFSTLSRSLWAIDIKLDGTIALLNGTECQTSTYRLGTSASYKGEDIDLLLKIIQEDNDYQGASCVSVSDNILSFHLRDTDPNENLAFMNIKITVVKKNTNQPIIIDKLYITNFDLDRSNTLALTDTDDVYYKNPTKTYLSENTNVTDSIASFYNGYTHKLKGQSTGNCNDSATQTTLECRAGVIYKRISFFNARLQNDNAYGTTTPTNLISHRLIQFSFEARHLKPLIDEKHDFGDAPEDYPQVSHEVADDLYFGLTLPDTEESANTSDDALGDDNDMTDDEDGITTIEPLKLSNSTYTVPVTIMNKTNLDAYITGWIDFNKNGIFEYDEALNTNNLKVSPSNALQTVNIVWDNTFSPKMNSLTEGKTIMRLRLSTSRILRCDSEYYSNNGAYEDDYFISPDGEVEDYEIPIISDGLRGVFNIERTNSNLNPLIGSEERNAWFTQIVGRDFDYSIVFYNEELTSLQEMDNISVRLELVDMDTNKSLYERSAHILSDIPLNRLNIILPANDLSQLPATKNARFRITYGVDIDGNIIQDDCLNNPNLCTLTRTDYALDNFAIRPESFYISLADNNIIRKENTLMTPDSLRVASGYDYNLTIKATPYPNALHTAVKGYNTLLNTFLTFNPLETTNCADESNVSLSLNFNNGYFNDLNFSHSNVGIYNLKVQDNNWTQEDLNKNTPDCILNQSFVSNNPNTLSGCNIETISDMNLSFQPYQFGLNFNMNNLPNAGHDDFIYMSDLNSMEQNTSIQFLGSITAQNKNNETTTNFTQGCVAENLQLIMNTTTLTEDGNVIPIQTAIHPTRAREDVNISQMARFNNEPLNITSFSTFQDISSTPINISKNKFLDINNASLSLDLRYNIQKHRSLRVNPVQITFHTLDVNAIAAYSTAKKQVSPNPYIPTGVQDLNNSIRNFYFSRVSPDIINYSKIHFPTSKMIRTPLNVDIFCNKSIDYCRQTNIVQHTDTTGLSKIQDGWYISTDHHPVQDGMVRKLNPNENIITVSPAKNIIFSNGRNGLITSTFNTCNETNHQVIVQIVPDTALLYDMNPVNMGRPHYIVSCSDKNASELSGVGQTGNIINNIANEIKPSKLDW